MLTRKRLAGFIVLTGVVCSLLWVSHWPQTLAVQWAVRSMTGAEIELDLTGTYKQITIANLSVYPDEPSRKANDPLFIAKGITLSYQLWGNDGRFLPDLQIERLDLHPNASDPDSPNYQFILDFLTQDSDEESSFALVPEAIHIGQIQVRGRWEEYEGDTDALSLDIRCVGLEDIEVVAGGSDVRMEVALGDESVAMTGDVEWTARYNGTEVETAYTMAFPGWIVGSGFVNVLLRDGVLSDWAWVSDQTVVHAGVLEAAVLAGKPLPGSFESITFAQAKLHGSLTEYARVDGGVDVQCSGLNIVRGEAALFEGDIQAKARFVEGDTLDATVELNFGEERILNARMTGGVDSFEGKLNWSDWTKDGVMDLTPRDFQSTLRTLQFDTLGGSAVVARADTGYEAVVHIHSKSSDGQQPVFLDLDLKGDPQGGRWPEGHVDARLGKGVVQGAGFYQENGDYAAEVVLESIRLKRWAYVLAGTELPDEFEGKMKGSIHAVMAKEDESLRIVPNLSLYELKYEDFFMQEVTFTGEAAIAPDRRSWSVSVLSVTDRGGDFTAELSDWSGSTEDSAYEGSFTVELDTSLIAEPMRWYDLFGTLSISGEVRALDNHVEFPLTVSSDDLGYGDWLLPYGSEMVVKGIMISNLETGEISSDKVTVGIGDGTRFTLTGIDIDPESSNVTAMYVAESNMALGVEMGYAAEAVGTVAASGEVSYTNESIQVTYKVNVAAAAISLLENAATVSGLNLQLDGIYKDDSLDGMGKLNVREVSAAGATMHEISGDVRLLDTKMILPKVQGKIFDGKFIGHTEVGVLEETMPIWLNGSYEDIDLASLTKEVQPPGTELTGLASGTLSAEYSTEGLLGFVLNAESKEGFSMNRSMVEEIMQTQTLLRGIGAKKAEKAVSKFLGEAPQRPFDSATLYVYLVDNVINGVSELRSVKTRDYNGLNLTINLDIDKPALIQSLKLLEESNISDVEF